MLPGDSEGNASFPARLAENPGKPHSPPEVFRTCLAAVVPRGTAKALVLGGRVCSGCAGGGK